MAIAKVAAEWPAIGFHDLRKTYLTRLANGGLPVHLLKVIAGHSVVATTLT